MCVTNENKYFNFNNKEKTTFHSIFKKIGGKN
jgi:hypothetical protein